MPRIAHAHTNTALCIQSTAAIAQALTTDTPISLPTHLTPLSIPAAVRSNMPADPHSSNSDSYPDDDDGFVLPSFSYAIPDNAYQPAPWECQRSSDKVNDVGTHTTRTRLPPEKDQPTAPLKVQGATGPPSRVLLPSAIPKPRPTPALDALTELALQGLTSPAASAPRSPSPSPVDVGKPATQVDQLIAMPISESPMRDLEVLMSARSPELPQIECAGAYTTPGSVEHNPLVDLLSDDQPRTSWRACPTQSSSDVPKRQRYDALDDDLVPLLSFSPTSPSTGSTGNAQEVSSGYPSTQSERPSSYQDSVSDSPAPPRNPAGTFASDTSSVKSNMLDSEDMNYDSLHRLLNVGGVFVRVEGPKNNKLVWTGDPDTSGYFGRNEAFKDLTPSAYEVAVRAAGLDRPNWLRVGYLWRSMDAHRWPDQGVVPPDSPWISATNNLEWAIWRTANILASASTVYMTFIKPTGERFSLPTSLRKASKISKANSEAVFYGRIFAGSIIARVKWTRAVSRVDLQTS